MAALAHRPALLLLDEPSSGLDPIVRRDILQAIVKTIADEGRTVLFSSHLLEEVERMSDRITMIQSGKIAFSGSLEEIRASHARAVLRFEAPVNEPPFLEGALAWSGGGREWSVLWTGSLSRLEMIASEHHAELLDPASPTLNEIFVARAADPEPLQVK
jgi:ABC-2 type transport system ATP-binding protein